jgi:coproporphyrinogen III oxidase-like Fe-S oxidoreductase
MLDTARLERRRALHDRYMAVARVGDASRLAYLHGPATIWREEEVAALWHDAARHPVGTLEPLNCVYIHVPFCKSICTFCNYDRLQPSSSSLLRTWLARTLRSIEVMAPALEPLTFHALYIGGGTPSVLPAPMLHELLTAIDTRLRWHPHASRKLEFDPAVINRKRLEVLAAHNIRQLSFGIETLDPDVTERHNRGRQGIEVIERTFADLQALGMDDVACDLLLGLEGTTPDGMLIEMATIMERFRPAWLDIFMLTPTQHYVDRHFNGSQEAFWAHLKPFEERIPPALPALAERYGYFVRMGHGHHMMLTRQDQRAPRADERPAVSGRQPTTFGYTALTSESRRPLNVFGLGRSARSVIFGRAAFSLRDPNDDPAASGPAEYEGNRFTIADEARSFLVHHLRDNDTVDRAEFRAIFGDDIAAIVPEAVAAWQAEGVAQLEPTVLRFVPQERRVRIHTLLWLVPQAALEFDLAHFDEVEADAARRLAARRESPPRGRPRRWLPLRRNRRPLLAGRGARRRAAAAARRARPERPGTAAPGVGDAAARSRRRAAPPRRGPAARRDHAEPSPHGAAPRTAARRRGGGRRRRMNTAPARHRSDAGRRQGPGGAGCGSSC